MPTLSTSYLLPAIFLNPAFVLHIINTFASHMMPPTLTPSHSPHPFMESIGPLPGSTPYMDVHADDQMCWRYTVIMVIVQILAFGRVSDNRVQRKSAKAAKLERERIRKEILEKKDEQKSTLQPITNGHALGMDGVRDLPEHVKTNGVINDAAKPNGNIAKEEAFLSDRKSDTEESDGSEESLTETSEEEMMV